MEFRYRDLLRRLSGAFDPNGNFDYFELWSGVSRSLFDDKLEIKLQLLVARLFRRDR